MAGNRGRAAAVAARARPTQSGARTAGSSGRAVGGNDQRRGRGRRRLMIDDRPVETAPRPARSLRPSRRHIARTATSATLPRFSIARADTIDRSADNITYTPTSHGAPPFTRSNAVATIGVRPLAKMPDTW